MLVAAVTADPLGVLVAFGAGIISFLSPCVLPLVPGYLSMVSGLSAAELGRPAPRREPQRVVTSVREPALVGAGGHARAGATVVAAPEPVAPGRRPLAPLLRGVLLFIAGFTVVFVALGAAASSIHPVLKHHEHVLTLTAGALVVVLGGVLLLSALPAGIWARVGASGAGRIGWLVGERRIHIRPQTLGAWAAPVMGMAFAFAWTPCIGPVLSAVLALAAVRSTLAGGIVLLLAYSLGLGVPFLVTALAFDRLTGLFARARRRLALVQVVAAAILVAFGVVLLTNHLGWVSAQFSSLLDHLGLQRLTTS